LTTSFSALAATDLPLCRCLDIVADMAMDIQLLIFHFTYS